MRRERILKVILGCLGLVFVGIFVNLTQNGAAVGETQPPTVQPEELAKYTLMAGWTGQILIQGNSTSWCHDLLWANLRILLSSNRRFPAEVVPIVAQLDASRAFVGGIMVKSTAVVVHAEK
jgi:hypothetical protein